MILTSQKPKLIIWLGFFNCGDKLLIKGGLLRINDGLFHDLCHSISHMSSVINNRISYAFLSQIKPHLFNTHKTQTRFSKLLDLKALGLQLVLYPQLRLYYTTTTNFFNI